MQYANTIKEVPNACKEGPLSGEELNQYFVDTMAIRTGDTHFSPMDEIAYACCVPSDYNSFLLLGHRGCGKSTELNQLAKKLKAQGYPVYSIPCNQEINVATIEYTDLLILMGDALMHIAKEQNVPADNYLVARIQEFWKLSIEKVTEDFHGAEDERSVGASGEMGFLSFFKLSASIKGSIKYSDTSRTVYRETITRRSSEWIALLRQLIDQITEKSGGFQPVLIFEDLDKLTEESAWNVFTDFSGLLSALSCPVIYTFPIALSYSPKFASLESYFEIQFLPMVKIENVDGSRNQEGYDNIRSIMEKRMAVSSLFEPLPQNSNLDTLDYLIEKTGGALRDLFRAIAVASRRAANRGSDKIAQEDADQALMRICSDLTRRIDSSNYSFLADICKGDQETKERIENTKMLLDMLQAGVVLEYNGRRWHNVHPLVKDFLIKQGMVADGQH